MFAVNVRAPFFLMQDAIKLMRRERIDGTIVNIGSMSAKAGQPFIAAYCASKGALATLTKNTAYAVLRNRIRVNGLNIGWMATRRRGPHPARIPRRASRLAGRRPRPRSPSAGWSIRTRSRARSPFCRRDESGLMTGSMVNFDQSIWGAYDASPHPAAPL